MMRFENVKVKNVLAGLVMILAAGLAVAMTPTYRIADQGPAVNLEKIIPARFGDWAVDEKIFYQQVSPEVKASLDKIYTQVLTRTYLNSQGYRIMVSIPYGANQSDGLSAHDPEGCYPAQGFQIMSKSKDVLHTEVGDIPVRRMEAVSGMRNELVTYWFTVGSYAVNNDWERKKAQMRYSIKGQIPDGLLFRASSIDDNTQEAYRIQGLFIQEMVKALSPEYRARVTGLSY
ncbi:MAG: EpsI family protein [Methylotenera sp.]|nr:EpsI family protein [Methylotenera sp.]MDP2404405.1 EpsI family protein [Methylotenera sp.]MDZ4222312.1 EpsI family protein [Methylotenera sp.]